MKTTSSINAKAQRDKEAKVFKLKKTFAPLLLCVFALMLLGIFPQAANAKPGKEETRALTFAKKAFQDGIYDAAALNLGKFLKDFPDSELEAEARIFLAQCRLFQGQPGQALTLLAQLPATTPEQLKPEFIFWQAEANFSLKNWAAAAALYRQMLQHYPAFQHRTKARLNLSAALLQTEGENAALTALEPLLDNRNNPADQQQALLQKVRIFIGNNQLDEAARIVDRMARGQVDRKTQYQLWYWIAELARLADQPAKAIENYRKITGDPRAQAAGLMAKSWLGLGQVYQEQKQWPAASEAFLQAYVTTSDPEVMQVAVTAYLDAQLQNNTLTQGTLNIRQAARDHGAAGRSGLYAIGLFYYHTANYDAAITELDGLGAGQPGNEWTWPAQMLVAECFLKKNDPAAAAKVLRKIRAQTANPPLALDAAYRLAELQAQAGDYAEAGQQFLAVARQSANAAQVESAYFQALMLLSRTGQTAEFTALQTEFTGKFPASPRLADIAMEQARILEQAGQVAGAQKIYQTLIQSKDHPEVAAEALFRLAQTQYQSGATDEALKNLAALEATFPQYRDLAGAIYLRLLIQQRQGQLPPDDFRAALNQLIARFPKNDDLAARAWFQVANAYFDQGNYGQAQVNFQQVADKYPGHPLVDAALYAAGKCAMNLGNYPEAVTTLEKIPDHSALKPDARVMQIRCYIRSEKWAEALRIADSVIASRPPDPIWADASLRKVNCLYRLAKDNAKQYDAALTVINQLLAANHLTMAQRNEAGCLKGDILGQQQQPTAALAAYLDVVYGRLLPSDVTGLPAEPEHYWFNRAGVAAAQLLEDQGDIKGEIQVYRILERLSEPFRDEFRKKIDELKARHFIYEEGN